MAREVVVALVQSAGRGSDIQVNEDRNLELIDEAAESRPDFIVFDELSTTPYFPAAPREESLFAWAETIPGSYTKRVGRKALERSCCVVVPMFERAADGYYNSCAVVGPDGRLVRGRMPGGGLVSRYAKVHLPFVKTSHAPIDENSYFKSGPGFPVFDTPKARIGVVICYDRRFPESFRTLALQGAQVVFVPGNFPLHSPLSPEVYLSETRSRASENHTFVVSCNKAGFEMTGGVTTTFLGRSCVVGPDGAVLGGVGPSDRAAILTATLDLDAIELEEKRAPLFRDRSPDKYVNRPS
jgi:beta-ureidopropionase